MPRMEGVMLKIRRWASVVTVTQSEKKNISLNSFLSLYLRLAFTLVAVRTTAYL